MIAIRRRAVLIGGVAAAGLGIAFSLGRRAADANERLRLAEADYLSGNVALVDGWIVSSSEARALELPSK